MQISYNVAKYYNWRLPRGQHSGAFKPRPGKV